MADAISSCIAKTSVIGRSYRSDHKWVPSAAAISWAVTRIRSPARRTLPSSTLVTPSAWAMLANILVLPLERERRRARDHLQSLDLREGVDDLFSETVAEVFVLPVCAQIGKRQHGDRRRHVGAPDASGVAGRA